MQLFRTFTSDLLRHADWLTACGVMSVAMEAPGVYWIPIDEVLETPECEVLLFNARHLEDVRLQLINALAHALAVGLTDVVS